MAVPNSRHLPAGPCLQVSIPASVVNSGLKYMQRRIKASWCLLRHARRTGGVAVGTRELETLLPAFLLI